LRPRLRLRILWAVARKKKPKIERALPTSLAAARQVQGVCDLLRPKPGQVHGNTALFDHDVFTALLCAFFDPMVRSQRTIGQLSEVPAVQEQLDVERIARSTLSDALARFRTEALYEVLRILRRQLPLSVRGDADVQILLGKLVAIDASYFNMAGDIAWALRQRNVDGVLSRVRLDMQLDVQRWTAEKFAVHGAEMGSEATAQKQMLEAGVIYLADRLYANYNFVDSVLQARAHFVTRAKKDLAYRVQEQRPLCQKDHEAQVQFDDLVLLGTGEPAKDKNKQKPPRQVLRLVTIWDEKNLQQVTLLTDLLDVPAWVIGYLYRCRWIIELFFRWLKVTASMEHLLSHNANGITVQFYVGVIAVMLMHIQTGLPVSKYSLVGLSFVARGQARAEDVMPGIMRLERERMLEKQRLARKKAMQKTPKLLPR
jgi:hypothetical protein